MITILIFIAILLLLIIGHELGHFLTAKKLKIPVPEFGIGFPPKLFGVRWGETEYTINLLPFGGFVRILGEEEKDADNPEAFRKRSKRDQSLVLFAGPFANLLIAVVLSTLALFFGTTAMITEQSDARDARVLVGEVLADRPAEIAGIQPGDIIVSVESEAGEVRTPRSPAEVSAFIKENPSPMVFTLLRSGEEVMKMVTPTEGLIPEYKDQFAIGIAMAFVGTVSYPLHEAFARAVVVTAQNTVFVVTSLFGLIVSAFSFSFDISQLAGPVGIASITGDAAARGVGAVLSFAALLSINLAVINLLPFPALDGGRLLFLFIEAVSRRNIPEKFAQYANAVGFLLLIFLMVAITIQDISRLIR